MCGIIASKSITKFKELILLNQSRGTFSHSLTALKYKDDYTQLAGKWIYRHFDEFNFKIFDNIDENLKNMYFIGHVQAPTGGLIHDWNRIHPSNIANSSYLYHNGILKPNYVKKWLIKDDIADDNIPWDTQVLNNNLFKYGFNCLDDVKGSFACMLIKDEQIYCFRNNNSIIYYDEDLNFSSMKFDGSNELPSGEVFKLDLHDPCLIFDHTFQLLDDYYVEI